MIWLGEKRGNLSDWVTQLWVHVTGRDLDLSAEPWLDGPAGSTRGIGEASFEDFARHEGLAIVRDGAARGIVPDFGLLGGPSFDPDRVDPAVACFYGATSGYELDAWSHWCGAFRPFGWLLAVLFSRRLQQLNVPLTGLDTSRGVTNEVWHLVERPSGRVRCAVWIRRLIGRGDVLYAGSYSVCTPPGHDGPCLRVAFPLPNGNALVIMQPKVHADGSLSLVSSGEAFGGPGFYFTVHGAGGRVRVRRVNTMRETIHVQAAASGEARADHELRIFGAVFLRLHYRMRPLAPEHYHRRGSRDESRR